RQLPASNPGLSRPGGGHPMKRLLVFAAALTALAGPARAAEDTPKAAETRKKLKQKVTVDYKNELLRNIVDDLKEQVKGLSIRIDVAGGVSQNRKITYKAKDKPLEEVLDEMFKKEELGYIVISKDKDAYDGSILIRAGQERGYPKGEDPTKDK